MWFASMAWMMILYNEDDFCCNEVDVFLLRREHFADGYACFTNQISIIITISFLEKPLSPLKGKLVYWMRRIWVKQMETSATTTTTRATTAMMI
jgi:hypothetical protein